MTAFLGLFPWVFRHALLFPRALVVLPIGIGAIWLLNTARVAALVSLGAHVSPEVAIGGFHSQAGWIAFLPVTIGTMASPSARTGGKSKLLAAPPRQRRLQ